jgi:uncharacterized protein (DUF305 family)
MKWMTANGSEQTDHSTMSSGSMSSGAMASGSTEPASMQGMDRMPGMATDDELRRLRSSSGPALDALFLQLMLRHHEGGTGMLTYAAQYASISDVRNLASRMLTAQTTESEYMRQLLTQFGAAPLPS